MYQTAPWAQTRARKASSTSFRFAQRPKASTKGALEASPSAFIFANAGLSASLSRMTIEIASRPAETRKGTRQPQASKAPAPKARPMTIRLSRMTISAASRPMEAELWIQLVDWPRAAGRACSAT